MQYQKDREGFNRRDVILNRLHRNLVYKPALQLHRLWLRITRQIPVEGEVTKATMAKIPILLYHQITELNRKVDSGELAVPRARFAQQMDYLRRRRYHCLPLETVVRASMLGEKLPSRTFSITFDDGYRDSYEHAFPVLQRYHCTATIFLVTGRIGSWSNWEGQTGDRLLPLLSWVEIREMHQHGMQFGSHSHTHPFLDSLGYDQAAWEIGTSKQILEEGLGHPIGLFAFPYGRVTPALQRLVERCGYIGACGSTSLPDNRFNLWRVECCASDSLLHFIFKISRWWPWLTWLRKRTRLARSLRWTKDRLRSKVQGGV